MGHRRNHAPIVAWNQKATTGEKSIPLWADGTFDEKEEAIINELGAWMEVNKESIIGTRPWVIFGEGPVADSNIEVSRPHSLALCGIRDCGQPMARAPSTAAVSMYL